MRSDEAMKLAAIAICLLLPSLSVAQTACPADPKIYRCLYPPVCDAEGRRELLQVLTSHREMLLAATPELTPAERDWYQSELDSGDGERFISAVQSNVGSRIAVRSALDEQGRMLTLLDIMLNGPGYFSPEGQTPARRGELLRSQQAGWVRLGRAFADSSWLPAWDRLRDARRASGTRDPVYTVEDDLQTCSNAARVVLRVALDDFAAYSRN
jgi:hypothetical protein